MWVSVELTLCSNGASTWCRKKSKWRRRSNRKHVLLLNRLHQRESAGITCFWNSCDLLSWLKVRGSEPAGTLSTFVDHQRKMKGLLCFYLVFLLVVGQLEICFQEVKQTTYGDTVCMEDKAYLKHLSCYLLICSLWLNYLFTKSTRINNDISDLPWPYLSFQKWNAFA